MMSTSENMVSYTRLLGMLSAKRKGPRSCHLQFLLGIVLEEFHAYPEPELV